MIMLDKVSYTSKMRYLNPTLKTLFAIGSLFLCIYFRVPLVSCTVFCFMVGCTIIKGGISFIRYLKYLSIPFAFLLLSTIALPFNLSQTPLDLWSFPFLGNYLTISQQGLMNSINLTFTSLSCISCLYLLLLTTPIMDIIGVLKKLHCPSILLELMLLMYRFIFILLDLGETILTSQKCRLGHKDMKTSILSTGKMLSVLLINALHKSNYLYDAMEARCYNGNIPILNNNVLIKRREFIGTILYFGILISIGLLSP